MQIKRCVMAGRVRFTVKARDEMRRDGLTVREVFESIVNAQGVYKVLRSTSPDRGTPKERLYVIRSFTFEMTPIYTKGKLVREGGEPVFYVLVSSKLDAEA
ncbi:MAG: hypothetical protein JXA87_14820 [Thermoleophilia bacterium]|nr:hypothetical protein [Thermoleophilia bacterium]